MSTGVSCQTDVSQRDLGKYLDELQGEIFVLQNEIRCLKLQISNLQTSLSKRTLSERTLKEDFDILKCYTGRCTIKTLVYL